MIDEKLWYVEDDEAVGECFRVLTCTDGVDVPVRLSIDGRRNATNDFFQAMELAYQWGKGQSGNACATVVRVVYGRDDTDVAYYEGVGSLDLPPWSGLLGEEPPTTRGEGLRRNGPDQGAAEPAPKPTPPDGSNHPEPGTAG